MKLSVCTEAVFNQVPTELAMKRAKDAKINAIEFWNWQGKNIDAIDEARKTLNIEIAAFCTSFTNLVDENMRDSFIQGLRETILIAKRLGCKTLITTVGNENASVPRKAQQKSIIDGLRQAAPQLRENDITLVVEPLNTLVNHQGHYLSTSDEANEIISEVNSPNIKILFDFYHQQITEGNLISRSLSLLPHIGHIHCAGNPGRHELSIGEINYPSIFKALANAGYNGYIGLEYFPTFEPNVGLSELAISFGQDYCFT